VSVGVNHCLDENEMHAYIAVWETDEGLHIMMGVYILYLYK